MTRPLLALLALGVCLGAADARAAPITSIPVVVLPGLELDDLAAFADTGAVGLLVPSAGPETSEALARATIERGEARNSLRGGLPDGPRLIELRTREEVSGEPLIVLGLPEGGEQANDRRYPIAVFAPGYRGVLTSPSTRIAGLVSAVDVAPTARGEDGKLGSRGSDNGLAELVELEGRIRDNGDARQPASIAAALIVALLALARPRAAPLGVAAALGANLVLGVADVSTPWISVLAIAGSAALAGLAPTLRPLVIGGVCAVVVAAYLVAMGIDDSWVALSPLGPSQNSRFFGVSNLLETMLLLPALVAAALLARRFGVVAFAAVALVTLVAVAGSRFGADGGGAIVLAAAFAVLAWALVGGGRRAIAIAGGGVVVAVALLALDAALGPATHVGETVSGGPLELAGDLVDRVELSFRRATAGVATAIAVVVGIVVLVVLALRLRGLSLRQAALPLAFAAGIAVSLIVNDSPVDVTIWGVAGLIALTAWATRDDQGAQLESGRSSL